MSQNQDNGQKMFVTSNSRRNSISDTLLSSFNDSGYISLNSHSCCYGTDYLDKCPAISTGRFRTSRFKPYSKLDCKSNFSKYDIYKSIDNSSQNILVNSVTDSCDSYSDLNPKIKPSNRLFAMELRSCQKKQFQQSVSCISMLHNYSFQDVSSPSLSAAYSNFTHEFTCNNKRIKLMVPQSTPHVIRSPILNTSSHKVTFSPISYRDRQFINSVNSMSFYNLSISKFTLTSTKNQPVKLDLNKYSIFADSQKNKTILDYSKRKTLDIFKFLGEKSNHPKIISKILNYLKPQDLCSISLVSKSWQRICKRDAKAEERRLKHIMTKQYSKENFESTNKSKFEEVQLSPKTRYPRRGFLTAVSTNLLQISKSRFPPSSPPVSPSKVIFHSFIKASRSLAPQDQLIPCPQCKFACRLEQEKNIGVCSRPGCPMEVFCILCLTKLHTGEPCKMLLLTTPTKKKRQRQSIVGTKQCKRNLRRISRLIQ